MELRSNNPKVTLAVVLALALTTWPCFAHGEQILPLPLSNGLAVFCFVIFLAFWRQHLLFKVLAFTILVLGIVLSWALPLLPRNTLEWVSLPVGSVFAVGFGVPVALAAIGCVVIQLLGVIGGTMLNQRLGGNGGTMPWFQINHFCSAVPQDGR